MLSLIPQLSHSLALPFIDPVVDVNTDANGESSGSDNESHDSMLLEGLEVVVAEPVYDSIGVPVRLPQRVKTRDNPKTQPKAASARTRTTALPSPPPPPAAAPPAPPSARGTFAQTDIMDI